MAINYHGTYAAIRAFVPVLEANGGGQIVNVLSLLSLASSPPMTGYAASKAAAHSLTQALRPVLADDQDDIFPDPNSRAMAPTWWSDPKAFERAFSGAAAA
jgi:NAD(P)-dependent dehydrogenase (short-subunit alcohol dehydrogenase family)